MTKWTLEAFVAHFEELRRTDKDHEKELQEGYQRALDAALRSVDKENQAALAAVNKANIIALEALGERLKLLNEFKDTLLQQNSNYALREVVDAQVKATEKELAELKLQVTTSRSKGDGIHQAWLYAIGAVAVIGTLIAIYNALPKE